MVRRVLKSKYALIDDGHVAFTEELVNMPGGLENIFVALGIHRLDIAGDIVRNLYKTSLTRTFFQKPSPKTTSTTSSAWDAGEVSADMGSGRTEKSEVSTTHGCREQTSLPGFRT